MIEVQANNITTECFYFRLEGLTQVDPPSQLGWFAMLRTSNGAKDAYALVLSARLTETPVKTVTTGSYVCGHAEVSYIAM